MKRFKSTWLFGILVLILAAYVFWDFTEQKKSSASLEKGEVQITDFSTGNIKQIEILKGSESVLLHFDGSECQIEKPQKEKCDELVVQPFLDQLSSIKGRQVLNKEELSNRKEEFGLAHPLVTIKWKLSEGDEGELSLGEKNSYDGSFYLQRKDLYIVNSSYGQLTNKTFSDLRSHVIWQGPDSIQNLKIKGLKDGSLELSLNQKGSWDLTPSPAPYIVDKSKVEEWVQFIKSMRSNEILDEDPGLTPLVQYHFNDSSYIFEILKEKSNAFFIKEKSAQKFFKLSPEQYQKLNPSIEDFFDGRAPFQFPLEKVTDLFIQNEGYKIHFRKSGSSWQNVGPKENQSEKDSLKEQDLSTLFQRILALEAQGFQSSKAKFSRHQILLKDSSDHVLFQMSWGGDKKSEQQLVQIQGFAQAFQVSTHQLNEILKLFDPSVVNKESFEHDHHH